MQYDSIIFDLDGTLWNPTEVVLKAWNKILADMDKDVDMMTKERLHSIMGLQIQKIGEVLFPRIAKEEQYELVKICCGEERGFIKEEGGVLYDNLEMVLEELAKKYKLFIVSNCESGYIEAFFDYHKLGGYFKDIECAGNTGLSKGENIKSVIRRNNLRQPIYVGDTQGDLDGSKVAGIPFVYASYGFGKPETYHHRVDSLKGLLEIF